MFGECKDRRRLLRRREQGRPAGRNYGDTLTWTNKDTGNHQVLADQAAFPTSPVLAPNQTYSHTFTKSGNFGYRDALDTRRRGTVIVRPGLSMKASAAQVGYSGTLTLSGTVSSGAAGEP